VHKLARELVSRKNNKYEAEIAVAAGVILVALDAVVIGTALIGVPLAAWGISKLK
jgi:hypothetical protein